MATNTNETEAKYDAPAEVALPGLNRLPRVAGTSGPDEERLEAEHYGTAGRAARLPAGGPADAAGAARSGRRAYERGPAPGTEGGQARPLRGRGCDTGDRRGRRGSPGR